MAERLFAGSYHTVHDHLLRSAIERVRALPDVELLSPGLGGTLNKIADDAQFHVATLRAKDAHGTRRKEMRKRRDYGQTIDVEVSFIEVSIPFSGDPQSLKFAPSQSTMIDLPTEIRNGTLVIHLPDGDNFDRDLDSFVSLVQGNLDRLTKEAAGLRDMIRSQIGAFADQRIAEAKARKDRDSKRGIPIS